MKKMFNEMKAFVDKDKSLGIDDFEVQEFKIHEYEDGDAYCSFIAKDIYRDDDDPNKGFEVSLLFEIEYNRQVNILAIYPMGEYEDRKKILRYVNEQNKMYNWFKWSVQFSDRNRNSVLGVSTRSVYEELDTVEDTIHNIIKVYFSLIADVVNDQKEELFAVWYGDEEAAESKVDETVAGSSSDAGYSEEALMQEEIPVVNFNEKDAKEFVDLVLQRNSHSKAELISTDNEKHKYTIQYYDVVKEDVVLVDAGLYPNKARYTCFFNLQIPEHKLTAAYRILANANDDSGAMTYIINKSRIFCINMFVAISDSTDRELFMKCVISISELLERDECQEVINSIRELCE